MLVAKMSLRDQDHTLIIGVDMKSIKEFISSVQEVVELLSKRFM